MGEKYVLILGAGLMQRPSIEAAKELGYRTLVIDANPQAVCVPFADRFEKVDLKDREAIASLALSLKDDLAGIFTAGTDFSASVSYAAERCGLPSHSFQAALNASNKILMRKCFSSHNIPSPDFFEADEAYVANVEKGKAEELSFPKVVKPVDNMGARGCRLVRSRDEFLPALKEAVSYSRTGKAIVEDYMSGPEFSIDALVYNGKVTITGFADRHIFFEPYFIELGHTMPSSCSPKVKAELIECFTKAVHALGLSSGVAKGDIKYTEKGPMIGEIAGRLSGGYMSGWTFPYSSDVNLTKEAMKIALGQVPESTENDEVPSLKFSHERAFISIPGKIKSIYGQDNAIAAPFVKNIFSTSVEVLKTVWDSVGQPIFNLIIQVIGWVRDAFAERMPQIQAFFSGFITDASNLWNNNLKPCLEAIGNFISNVLAPAFTSSSNAIDADGPPIPVEHTLTLTPFK